jgi:hypothetical protein
MLHVGQLAQGEGMEDFRTRAIAHLQKRVPQGPVLHGDGELKDMIAGTTVPVTWLVAYDPNTGIKHHGIAMPILQHLRDVEAVASQAEARLRELDAGVYLKIDNAVRQTGHAVESTGMLVAPKVLLYCGDVQCPYPAVLKIFSRRGQSIEIVNEAEMHRSVFISYGQPDEAFAARINSYLKAHHVPTWFFPENALPGQKLHRMMHDGVNHHERVLLICSEKSLQRSGVLNELERVLEREAKEGGEAILVPISLDDHVYGEWSPARPDLASQVRARVVTRFQANGDEGGFDASARKLLAALKRIRG